MTEAPKPPEKPKRKKPVSPTQRARKDMLALGWTSVIVERWNPFAHIRQDFAGFADIIYFHPDTGIVACQVTTSTNHAARETKIEAEPRALAWMLAGGRVEVWSYAKRSGGVRGGRKLWTCRRTRAFLFMAKDFGGWTEIEAASPAARGAGGGA